MGGTMENQQLYTTIGKTTEITRSNLSLETLLPCVKILQGPRCFPGDLSDALAQCMVSLTIWFLPTLLLRFCTFLSGQCACCALVVPAFSVSYSAFPCHTLAHVHPSAFFYLPLPGLQPAGLGLTNCWEPFLFPPFHPNTVWVPRLYFVCSSVLCNALLSIQWILGHSWI